MVGSNLFCDSHNLHNEADVEQIFLRRFIEYLGYADTEIRPQDTLTKLTVGEVRGREALYRPDFAIKKGKHVRWIVEAKSPETRLDDYIWQPRGYCTLLNGQYRNENPVEYFLLSNGLLTRLYQWDVTEPLLELRFDDFLQDNAKFASLVSYLSSKSFDIVSDVTIRGNVHKLSKKSLDDVNTAFAWCHQEIYKKDNISQAAAFTEFVKVIFLKLLSDREIRDKYPSAVAEEEIEVPAEEVKFSSRWIIDQEQNTPSPIDTIQFSDFIRRMERDIHSGQRKRIFDSDERINLSPETIKSVVKRVEHLFLFGIDADLNGRLFETFLNATMRGKDLGQYFTPRSIVKLGTNLAMIRVNVLLPDGNRHTDIILDACCGSGGFLIDALSLMLEKVDGNPALSDHEKTELRHRIANEHIFGIDVGREPPLARIARLNMYLHGDGGSSIFQADALDKKLEDVATDNPEIVAEKAQLRRLFGRTRTGGFADVVLTNPPFAKVYEQKAEKEERILSEYDIAIQEGGKKRTSLKSSLMFIERYYDLLRPGGRLITVIDDGILSGRKEAWFRQFVRSHFIVRAVISLPGDAFQRSKARVKTSLLVLEKRGQDESQDQPAVFMYGCEYVGIDDPSRQRTLPIDMVNRERAAKEVEFVTSQYAAFLEGRGDSRFVVHPDQLIDRLDVKSCLMAAGRQVANWQTSGFRVDNLESLVLEKRFLPEDVIETRSNEEVVTYLRVRYDGFAEAGDEIIASDTQYSQLYRVQPGDIVISNIAASYGSVAIVPEELAGHVVTTEYTVLQAREGIDPYVIWMLLRSAEARADMLLLATGANRTRINWDTLKYLQLPRPHQDSISEAISLLDEASKAERLARQYRDQAKRVLEEPLQLDNDTAHAILRAFKPPR